MTMNQSHHQRKPPSQRSQPSQPSQPQRRETVNLPNLIEILDTEKGLRFLMSDGNLQSEFSMDGVIYYPVKPKLFSIPNAGVMDLIKGDDSNLFDDVRQFIHDHLDCPHETHYGVLTTFVLHTYLIEKTEASPIMRFYGPKGSGKSRGGEILNQLVRRGVLTANLTGPGLFRVNELYSPTLMIDEIQIFGKKGDKDLKEMLNVRYRRGNQIIRINKERNGLASIESFNAFGPTILCGTEEIPDTVRSRAITLFMEPNVREVRRHIDKERACNLRNRLVAFRFRHFKTSLYEPERIVSNGRLDEVLLPLHQIIRLIKPEFETEFVAFAKSIEAERNEEEIESLDAEVLRALVSCKGRVEHGRLAVDAVTRLLNANRDPKNLVSSRGVGFVLTHFGFKSCRIPGSGKYARLWDESRIHRLALRFNIDYPDGGGCAHCEGREGEMNGEREADKIVG
jgi:hypothetical protein